MHIKLAGWIALAFLGAIVAGVLWYVFFAPKAIVPPGQTTPITLPVSTSASTTSETQVLPLSTQEGGTVAAKDIIHNPLTVADQANEGNYLLTGVTSPGFSIVYREPADFFTIALEQEPLGETRQRAEQFLLTALGVSQSQLCTLQYYIGTDVHTNSLYAGRNLGFSFCSGAVPLPQ